MIFSSPRVKSLLLPGWGELSISQKSHGQNFLAVEVMLWLTVLNGKTISKNYESDYRAFASEYANVDWTNSDYLFAIDIGYYNTLDDYNALKERQRSLEIETDLNGGLIREVGHALYPENGDFYWDWKDNESKRQSYNNMRISSANWDKYANFAIS